MFNRNLMKDLKDETSGHFEDAIVALFETPLDYDCISINKAIKKSDEDTLVEIICTRPAELLKQICQNYLNKFNISLQNDISNKFKDEQFKTILSMVLNCKRIDINMMNNFAQELCAGNETLNKKFDLLGLLLSTRSQRELITIGREYHRLTNITLLDAINKYYKGKIKLAFSTLLQCLVSLSEYFANRLYTRYIYILIVISMKGLGTRDTQLIRICVTRDEIDMALIKRYYKLLYKTELIDDIIGDCSGSYRNLLIEVVDH